MPRLGVKTTWRVDSHFSPPAIHTGPTAYPQRRQRLTLLRAGRSAPHGRHRPGRERPPGPRAWRWRRARRVFTRWLPPSRGRSRRNIPRGKAIERRSESGGSSVPRPGRQYNCRLSPSKTQARLRSPQCTPPGPAHALPGRPSAFPRGTDGHGSDPPAEGGMGVHMPTLPDADRGIPKGGVAPFYGRVPRSGSGVSAAVPQLQDSQRHTEALARTWK